MATDFTKAPLQILIDLINETNVTALTTQDVTFTAPSVLGSGNKNTGVRITAVNGRGYTGQRDLTYDRVDLAAIPGARNKTFNIGSVTSAHGLIPALNAAYQLNLQPEDIEDDAMPTFDGSDPLETEAFTLRAKTGSYIFRGSLELIIDGNDVDLATLITVTELNGLSYPVY
jgi:hypothetical protein